MSDRPKKKTFWEAVTDNLKAKRDIDRSALVLIADSIHNEMVGQYRAEVAEYKAIAQCKQEEVTKLEKELDRIAPRRSRARSPSLKRDSPSMPETILAPPASVATIPKPSVSSALPLPVISEEDMHY